MRSQRALRYRDGADQAGLTAYNRSEPSLQTPAVQYANATGIMDREPAPVATAEPTLTGTATVEQTLTCTDGTWLGTSPVLTRQWRRDGAALSGATASTYVLVAGDSGKQITCSVTATTDFGATTTVTAARAIA